MIAGGNAVGKCCENKMEGENLWTIECLRGRLLAERMASKAAKEKEVQMANKLMELEDKLRIEIKSRNKAEKRMKLLMKKLGTLNILLDSNESECSLENSEVSSLSSSTASSYRQQEDIYEAQYPISNFAQCHIEEQMKIRVPINYQRRT